MFRAGARAESGASLLRLWAAILLASGPLPALAESPPAAVVGQVTDQETGAPVPGTRVVLQFLFEDSAGSATFASREVVDARSTMTDAGGRYRFEDVPPGIYRLAFEAAGRAGHAVDGLRVVAGLELRIDSDRVSGPAERVTVLGKNDGQGSGLSRLAFGRAELDSRPAALEDPFRALAGRAGISQESDFKSEMRIRGSEASDTTVLVDGQPLPYAYHFGGSAGSAGTLSADLVDEVQVHTGGFSVEYGDALAGVIDVSSRARRPESITGTAGLGSVLAHAAVSGPAGDGSWMFSGRMSDLGLYDERVSPDQAQGVQFHDLFAAFRQPLPGQARLEAVLLGAGNRFEADQGQDGEAVMTSRNRGGRMRIEAPVDERTLLRIQLADSAFSVRSSAGDGLSLDQAQARQDVAVSVLRLLGTGHRLSGGLGLERMRGAMAGTVYDGLGLNASDQEYDAFRVGAFVEDTWRPAESVSLRYGLRADRSSETGSATLSPRASLEVRPARGLALSCAAGRFVQFPRQEQIFLAAGEELRQQEADHFILGLEKSFESGLRIVVEGYRKELKDPIGEAVNRYIELPEIMTQYDRGRIQGAELTLEQGAPGGWSWALNYGYLHATQEKDGVESPRNADQRHGASLVLGRPFGRGWMAGGVFRFASGLPYSPLRSFNLGFAHGIIIGDLNSERLPAFHRLDLRLSRSVPVSWGRIGVQVDLLNVYNRSNERSVDVYYDDAEHTYFRSTSYQSPFLPVVAVSAEF